ncbi:MAG TPA: VOC family protein [Bacteroidales bacterium]|nr:VOC family protein [Bacteroidales bacterium]
MILDHVAIWTNQLEKLKEYYVNHFNGRSNEKYINKSTGFESYFLTFSSGSRIEIMKKPGIPENLNDKIEKQYQGIIHLSFGMDNMKDVDEKLEELKESGFRILRGPRKTGDGYYEFETLDPDNNRIEVSTKYVE